MAVISKQVFDKISSSDITCITILHPSTESCIKALYYQLLNTAVGSSKFFLLIYVLQTIIKWKKINKNFLKEQIKAYLRSICYGLCYGANFFYSACLIRKCMTRFSFYFIALSGICAGLSIFVESKENKTLNTSIYLNLVVETILRHFYWKKCLIRNTFQETLLFMCCSAALQYLLRVRRRRSKVVNFWFYYPPFIKEPTKNKACGTCTHQDSCRKYFFKGFSSYFIMGYFFNLLKYWATRINTALKHPSTVLTESLKKDKLLFGMLFGGYVGIFRIIRCMLRKIYRKEEAEHFAIAGFLAGSAYLFRPTIPILAICITTALQLLIQQIDYKYAFQSKVPVTEIVFALSSGFLFHTRFLLSESCPHYVKTMLATVTNGKADELYQQALCLFRDPLIEANAM